MPEAAEARTAAPGPAPLERLASATAGLRGWPRAGTAVLLGALGTAALPPVHAVPLLIVAFTGLLWLLDGAISRRNAFWIGWCFGFGQMASGLYWVAISFSVLPGALFGVVPFIVLGMLAVSGLAAGLALFPAAAALATHAAGMGGVARILAFAAIWAAIEWLRGHVLTGFPWNLAAYAWNPVLPVAQGAALVGAYGMTLVTVALAAAPATLGWDARGWRTWAAPLAAALLLATMWLGGSARLSVHPTEAVPDTLLRIVQGNIPQSLKWRRDQRDDITEHYIALSKAPGQAGVSAVIWPETAAPWPLWGEPERLTLVAAAAPPGGVLITGANRLRRDRQGRPTIWNSLHVIDELGVIVANYDKHHLVPFGEYMPLRSVLDMARLTRGAAGTTDFTPGPGLRTLAAGGLPPFSPLICYEAIFPGSVVARGTGASWLLNVTNDAWFGESAGPHQHFASARMRTIEEGMPLVRAANTGISGIVDPLGRITAKLDLGREGVLDAPLPRALDGTTPYARWGDWTFALLLLAAASGAAWAGRSFRQ